MIESFDIWIETLACLCYIGYLTVKDREGED
jgi:DUF438 domain-containing protein